MITGSRRVVFWIDDPATKQVVGEKNQLVVEFTGDEAKDYDILRGIGLMIQKHYQRQLGIRSHELRGAQEFIASPECQRYLAENPGLMAGSGDPNKLPTNA